MIPLRSTANKTLGRLAVSTAIIFLVAALIACSGGDNGERASATIPGGEPRWPQPVLVDPTVVSTGQGYSDLDLDPERDYRIELPASDKLGGVTLEGGHNIVLIGGQITVPADQPPGSANDRFRTGIYIKGATGTVDVEGVLLNGKPGAMWDAIDIDAPKATVQLQDVRVDGVRGRFQGFHGDVVQPWGGVKVLRIDRLTASTNYQGLTIPIDEGSIEAARISRVNIRGLSRHAEEGGHLIWLTTGIRQCRSYPVSLQQIYLEPRPGLSLSRSVWPQASKQTSCGAKVGDGVARWPRLPVTGRVHKGKPPQGDYVPEGVAGVDYGK